jgi:hypothetical protein
MRTKVTKETIKVGMFLMTSGGYTMRHVKFFEVKEVKGAKVFLAPAAIERHSDQYGQEGQDELLGSLPGEASQRAKFTKKGLLLADDRFCVGNYFSSMRVAYVGDKESFYGD